jgi:hypothetical protein
MTDKILKCWICGVGSTCDNQVDIINTENLCQECQQELIQIEEEERGKGM